MSLQDKHKWDKKFSTMPELLQSRPPSTMVKNYHQLAPAKVALDLACGGGRHTLFLADKGFVVDGVDISEVAIERLEKRGIKNVNLIQADLDNFTPKSDHYGLVVMTNFLDRDLIKRAKSSLMSGGIFVVETYMDDESNEKKDSNPNFLLQQKELLDLFEEFEIVEYSEFDNESYEKFRMKKSAVVARKL